MNRSLAIAGVAALLIAAPLAQANDRHVQMSISIGVPGFYAPPVYVAPPVYFTPPPRPVIAYYPAPYYGYYHGYHHHDNDDGYHHGHGGHGYGHGDGYRGDNGNAWRRDDRSEHANGEQIRYRERDR